MMSFGRARKSCLINENNQINNSTCENLLGVKADA